MTTGWTSQNPSATFTEKSMWTPTSSWLLLALVGVGSYLVLTSKK